MKVQIRIAPLPQNEQTPTCQRIHNAARAGRAAVPGRVSDDRVWNDPRALVFYRTLYEYDRNDGRALRQGGTAVSAVNFGAGGAARALGSTNPLPWIVGGGGFVAGRVGSYFEAKAQAYLDGIDARLEELQAEQDGTCPAAS